VQNLSSAFLLEHYEFEIGAFSNLNAINEIEAFTIAVGIFNKILESKTMYPSSLTFGWFIQACGRLAIPTDLKESQIEKAFRHCCHAGLVTEFVIHRLKGASSEALFQRLVGHNIKTDKKKSDVEPADLPHDWSRNSHANKGGQAKLKSRNS